MSNRQQTLDYATLGAVLMENKSAVKPDDLLSLAGRLVLLKAMRQACTLARDYGATSFKLSVPFDTEFDKFGKCRLELSFSGIVIDSASRLTKDKSVELHGRLLPFMATPRGNDWQLDELTGKLNDWAYFCGEDLRLAMEYSSLPQIEGASAVKWLSAFTTDAELQAIAMGDEVMACANAMRLQAKVRHAAPARRHYS